MVPSRRRGFTLIEILVVIAIIAILIGLLLPAVQKVREAANRSKCLNNLKQLGLACNHYHATYGTFPPGDNGAGDQDKGSWLFLVLPYMEQENLYKEVTAVGMTSAVNAGLIPKKLPFTRCPSEGWSADDPRYSNYIGSSGPQCNYGNCGTDIFQRYCNGQDVQGAPPDVPPPPLDPLTYPGYDPSVTWGNTSNPRLLRGMFGRGPGGAASGPKIRIGDVTDGTSNTIFIGETLVEQAEFLRFGYAPGWAGYNTVSQGQTIQPINYPILPTDKTAFDSNCATGCPNGDPTHCIMNWHVTWGFKSNHSGGALFCFVDGSVHFLSQNIDHQVYQYLGCRNDRQVVSIPE